MNPEPLTAPAIHRALAALDAGHLPDVATIRAALLLALTVGPLLVERRNLRAALAEVLGTWEDDAPNCPYQAIETGLRPAYGALRRARALLEEGQGDDRR